MWRATAAGVPTCSLAYCLLASAQWAALYAAPALAWAIELSSPLTIARRYTISAVACRSLRSFSCGSRSCWRHGQLSCVHVPTRNCDDAASTHQLCHPLLDHLVELCWLGCEVLIVLTELELALQITTAGQPDVFRPKLELRRCECVAVEHNSTKMC